MPKRDQQPRICQIPLNRKDYPQAAESIGMTATEVSTNDRSIRESIATLKRLERKVAEKSRNGTTIWARKLIDGKVGVINDVCLGKEQARPDTKPKLEPLFTQKEIDLLVNHTKTIRVQTSNMSFSRQC